jgi:hypothetical protein
MSYQSPKDVASSPGLQNVTGKFCFPMAVSYPGRINFDTALVRPLSIDLSEVVIFGDTGGFSIQTNIDGTEWGINTGDYVVLVGTKIDGIYQLGSVDLTVTTGSTFAYGPDLASTTGYLYFLNKDQKLIGTNTKFKKDVSVGDYIIVQDDASQISVQALKVTKIESDVVLYVQRGFVDIKANDYPLLVANKNTNRGVSLKINEGGVVVNESLTQKDDILTFYDQDGLAPVYGDCGSKTIQVLIQK